MRILGEFFNFLTNPIAEIPEVAALISHAVRSIGGKGLGVVMAISPLPLLPTTEGNQQSALKPKNLLLL